MNTDLQIQSFLSDFKSLLGADLKTQVIKEREREEGVLYSVIIRPFHGQPTTWIEGKEGWPATTEAKSITRKVGSAFKKASKKNLMVELDPDGFLLKPNSKRVKGKSFYPLGSAYLHMVFVKHF